MRFGGSLQDQRDVGLAHHRDPFLELAHGQVEDCHAILDLERELAARSKCQAQDSPSARPVQVLRVRILRQLVMRYSCGLRAVQAGTLRES